jgi:phosphoglycerate dehydrogenase-like enzyme
VSGGEANAPVARRGGGVPAVGARSATVLVTSRSFGRSAPELRAELEGAVAGVRYNDRGRPLTADELRAELAGVHGVIAGTDPFDAPVVESAADLRVIARYGAGTGNVDLDAARRSGVVVTSTPGANAVAVAELALALMLALARRVAEGDRLVRGGGWAPLPGVQLAGRTVGLLGLGAVGTEVARRVGALGCRVLAHDPALDAAAARERGAELAPPERVVAEADVLSLHLPVTEDTRGMVDAAFLTAMRPGALLVNTARGELVDEAALAEALDSGRLAGAALDTLSDEPPAPENPLLGRHDVILTPHVGAQTAEATAAMGRMALDDLLAVLDGREPKHPVGHA